MSNRTLGRVEFRAGDTTLALHYTINALCLLEEQLGEDADLMKIIGGLGTAPSLTKIRLLFWAGLRGAAPATTVEDAGTVIDAIGLQRAAELVAHAMSAAFGQAGAAGPLGTTPPAGAAGLNS